MKKLMMILLCMVSFSVFADDHSYQLSGEDETEKFTDETNYATNVNCGLTDEEEENI